MFLLLPILRRLLHLAIFVAILAVGAELLARKLIGDAVTHAVATRIGVSPKIGFGSTPLVVQIARGSLGDVTLSAQGARIDGLGPLSLSGTMRDVHLRSLTGLQGAIGSLEVDAGLPPPVVLGILASAPCAQSLPAVVRSGLTSRPRVAIFPGRVDLLPPSGRAAEVRLRPYAAGSTLRFAITGVDMHGAPAAAGEVRGAQARASCSRVLANLPFGIALISASARSGVLELSFSGRGASFSALG